MTAQTLSIPVKSVLRKLGSDIQDARLRRRIPAAIMSQWAFICRTTLAKVEKGDPSAGIGTYTAVLFALGLLDRLRDLANAKTDEIDFSLEEERLPKRIDLRPRHAKKTQPESEQARP
jgi:hypothetical protein